MRFDCYWWTLGEFGALVPRSS